MEREEWGEAGTILATITINKPDSLPEMETQMRICVFPSGHVTCGGGGGQCFCSSAAPKGTSQKK